MEIKQMHDHHNCSHSHSHAHANAPQNYNLAFALGISLNITFVIIEALYGYFANSLALLADAGHNLSDVAGLLLAWGALWLSRRKPTSHFTFGLRKSSILSALFNAIFLMIAVGIIIWEALHRLWSPGIVEYNIVIIIASIGIVINSLTAILFFKDKDHDINIKGAYIHMAADALISLGVVISGVIISYTSWHWLDPIVSVIISLIIIYGTWDLLKSSMRLSLDAVPANIDPLAVKKYLENIEDVQEVHDLHIWAMSSTETALSVHLTVKINSLNNSKIVKIASELKNKFKIHHPTIQLELEEENFQCHFQPEDIL
ncbi:MAG: cation diffusion facilitator family transporter [Bacteriovorax sp.]|nr:cation diffusion facilitator family transporter [Bacteriovorax sp.]